MKAQLSGKITIENNSINWIWKSETLAKIDIGDIVAIGELTIESLKDDYFLLFALKSGRIERISMYAEKSQELLAFLSQKFDSSIIETHLANSVKWDNKISYPKYLRGKAMFHVVEDEFYVSDEIKKLIEAAH